MKKINNNTNNNNNSSEKYKYISTDLFFIYVQFLKGNNLRADLTSTWPPGPFPIFIFEIYKGFWFLKMIWQFIPQFINP